MDTPSQINTIGQTSATIGYRIDELGTPAINFHELWLGPPGGGSIVAAGSRQFSLNTTTVGTEQTVTITGLNPGTRYGYNTIARNSNGVEVYGGGAHAFTTLAPPPPPTMYTVSFSTSNLFDGLSNVVNITRNRSSQTGTSGTPYSFTTTATLSSNQYEFIGTPTVNSQAATRNSDGSYSFTFSGNITGNDAITARWRGNIQPVPVPPPPLPAFDITIFSTTPPNQDGSGCSISATWTGNVYVRVDVDIEPDEYDETLYRTALFQSGSLLASDLDISANTSTSTRILNGTFTVTVPDDGYSNSGGTVTRSFTWMQPGMEPVPDDPGINSVMISLVDNVTGGTLAPLMFTNVSPGQKSTAYIDFDDGYEITHIYQIVYGNQVTIDRGDFDSSLGYFGWYLESANSRVRVEINTRSDAEFDQVAYELTFNGSLIEIEDEITRCNVAAMATLTNCSFVRSNRNFDIGDGARPFVEIQPNDGYEFINTNQVTYTNLSQFSLSGDLNTDFPMSIQARLGDSTSSDPVASSIANGNIGVGIRPKTSGTFINDSYTIDLAVSASEIPPVATEATKPPVLLYSGPTSTNLGPIVHGLALPYTCLDTTSITWTYIFEADTDTAPFTLSTETSIFTQRSPGTHRTAPIDLRDQMNTLLNTRQGQLPNFDYINTEFGLVRDGGMTGIWDAYEIVVNSDHPVTSTRIVREGTVISGYGLVGEQDDTFTGWRVDVTYTRPGGRGPFVANGQNGSPTGVDNTYAPASLAHEGNGLRYAEAGYGWRVTNAAILARGTNVRGNIIRYSGESGGGGWTGGWRNGGAPGFNQDNCR